MYPESMVVEPNPKASTSWVALNLYSGGTTRPSIRFFLHGFTGVGHKPIYGSSSIIVIIGRAFTSKPRIMLEIDRGISMVENSDIE